MFLVTAMSQKITMKAIQTSISWAIILHMKTEKRIVMRDKKATKDRNKGFTLIEVIIVGRNICCIAGYSYSIF